MSQYDAETEAEAGRAARRRRHRPRRSACSTRRSCQPVVPPAAADPPYYYFPDTLVVDRYEIDGETRDTVIAVRELDLDASRRPAQLGQRPHRLHARLRRRRRVRQPAGQRRPPGVLPAAASRRTGARSGEYEPRIYFGQKSPLVLDRRRARGHRAAGARLPGRRQRTLQPATPPTTRRRRRRASARAIKLLYALKFRDEQHPASDRVNRSRRSSTTATRASGCRRSRRASRWTATRTRRSSTAGSSGSSTATPRRRTYPYSRTQPLEDATSDSLTDRADQRPVALPEQRVNYIRNSVKATVDAYDGKVDAVRVGRGRPVLKAWHAGVPGRGQADQRDRRRADVPPALPRGPVQGAARRCSASTT